MVFSNKKALLTLFSNMHALCSLLKYDCIVYDLEQCVKKNSGKNSQEKHLCLISHPGGKCDFFPPQV